MYQLVGVVLAIALAALALGVGTNWISMDALPRREATILATTGFDALAAGAVAYRIANGTPPRPVAGGTLPRDFVPDYVELPSVPAGMAWTYGASAGRFWVCLSGDVSEVQWNGLALAAKGRPTGAAGFAVADLANDAQAACGHDAGGALSIDDKPASFPAPAALTFRLFQ